MKRINFNALFEYRKHLNILSFGFFKRLGYRFLHPGYFVNLLWILHNSTSRLNVFLTFAENDLDKIKEYINESTTNITGTDDYHRFLFTIVRISKPSIVVETGVNEGYSSQAILSAMNLNNFGKLYSIDLPNVSNASDFRSYNLNGKEVGYIVQNHLRKRWELRLGDAKRLLPQLLEELGAIEIFLHDSLHTNEHMSYEFNEANTFIKSNGLLISHDIQMNAAFKNFVEKNHGKMHILNYNVGVFQKMN